VVSSLKRTLQAGLDGLPPIDKSFKGHGAKGDPDFQAIGPPQKLVQLILGISEGIEKGQTIGPAVITEMKSLIWNKAIAVCLQRPEFAQAIFGQGQAPGADKQKVAPIHQLMPADYDKHMKTDSSARGGVGGTGVHAIKVTGGKRGRQGRQPGPAQPKQPRVEVVDGGLEGFAVDASWLEPATVVPAPVAYPGFEGSSDFGERISRGKSFDNSQASCATAAGTETTSPNLRGFEPRDDMDKLAGEGVMGGAVREMGLDIDVHDIDFDTEFLAMSGFC